MKQWEGVAFQFWRTSSVYGSINECFSSWVVTINDYVTTISFEFTCGRGGFSVLENFFSLWLNK